MQNNFPEQPDLLLFEETILKFKKSKTELNVAILYFFTNTTASFKSFNDNAPDHMMKFYGDRYSQEVELVKIYEKFKMKKFLEKRFEFSSYEKMIDYIENNPDCAMRFVAQNIYRSLNKAITLTPEFVSKIQKDIDGDNISEKEKSDKMKIILELNQRKEIATILNSRIDKIVFN